MQPDQEQSIHEELESITHFAQKSLCVANTLGVANELAPDDAGSTSKSFPHAAWEACANAGIQGWTTPTTYGGQGYSTSDTCKRLAALGLGCDDNGLLFALGTQMWGIQKAILRFGSDSQKEKYVRGLSSGEMIGGHAINEPDSGSDALNLSCTAKQTSNGYVLNGLKTYITLAPVARFSLVYASTNKEHGRWGISAFLVDATTTGYNAKPADAMMGLNSAPVGSIVLDNCEVPKTALLGKEGLGASIFNYLQLWERSLLLAPQLGTMKRQLNNCIHFAKTHVRNGVPISSHQSISHKIANMAIKLNTCQALQDNAVNILDADEQSGYHASMLKIQINEAFEQNSRDAIAIFGALGYSANEEHERNLRDAIGSSIYGGTNDMQRVLIASHLGL